MSRKIRFIMVGGFLGAGKTTTLARLARTYTARGLNVGIVTNDQASDLVDTNALRSQGFDVGEVAGACFCCHFNELMSTIEGLSARERPDVILAEPVGSCTDLVATVIRPISQLFDADFEIAPYAVILKPSHGARVLSDQGSGFSPKAAYILTKQLEEADAILINRIDELPPEEVEAIVQLVRQHYPQTPVLRLSARTGLGFDAMLELLDQKGDFGRRVLDIDYDTYAEGEAELGWLNASFTARAPQDFPLDDLLTGILSRLKQDLAEQQAETAHLKAIGLWEGFFGVANLVSSDSAVELSLSSGCQVREAEVIVNARVACDPEFLQRLVESSAREAGQELGAAIDFRQTQSFRPGRPVPTHRLGVN
jgi:G3E family GTPase